MSQKRFTLGHLNLILLSLAFCFSQFAFSVSVSGTEKQYVVQFLSTNETQSIFWYKCCPPDQVLNKNGNCLSSNSEQVVPPPSLEKRLKRDLENEGKRETRSLHDLIKYKRPVCSKGARRQFYYFQHSSIEEHLTITLQLIITSRINNQSLIVDAHNYCFEWEKEGMYVEACVPEIVKGFGLPKKVSKQSRENFVTDISTSSLTSSSQILLRKCCGPSHVIDSLTFTCVEHHIPWQLYPIESNDISGSSHQHANYNETWVSDTSTYFPLETEASSPLRVTWLTGMPNCKEELSYEVYFDQYDRYYVNSEGILITEQNGTVAKTPPKEFCMDAVIYNKQPDFYEDSSNNSDVNNTVSKDVKSPNIFSRQMALVCFESNVEAAGFIEDEEVNGTFSKRTLYAVLTGISSVFLLVTCLVYTVLRKELKLPGWLQFAYSIALLLTFTLLTIAQLWTQAIHDISKSLCRALGYGLHFSFLVCFFYLTSMNFEIFSSFRSTVLAHGFGKARGKRRFLEFTAFSIGFPTCITLLLLAVDSCDPDENSQGSLCILPTTGIGVESCVFDSKHKVAQLQYFYGFVGILLMVNLVIFVCTLVSLRNRERETRMAKRQSTSACDYDRLQLFTRLFLIMGILWTFEVISWLFQYFEVDERIQDIFIITDCLNASQGLAVFLMFVWKKQTWKQLQKKFKASYRIHGSRPLCRPNHNGTISSNNTTNGTSVKSSYLSSIKSTDSARQPSASMSTATVMATIDHNLGPLKSGV